MTLTADVARAHAEGASSSSGDGFGRVLPSELTGAPCIGRMAIPIVVPVVTGMDSAGHDIVVVVATELEDGSSSVDIDVVMNTEVLSTRPTLAQAGAYGHELATSAAASQAHGVRCSHATPPPSVSVCTSGRLLVARAPAPPNAHASRPCPPPSVVARASVERAAAPLSVALLAVADPSISCQAAAAEHGDSTRPPPSVIGNPSGTGGHVSTPGALLADAYRISPPPSVLATAPVASMASLSVADALQALETMTMG